MPRYLVLSLAPTEWLFLSKCLIWSCWGGQREYPVSTVVLTANGPGVVLADRHSDAEGDLAHALLTGGLANLGASAVLEPCWFTGALSWQHGYSASGHTGPTTTSSLLCMPQALTQTHCFYVLSEFPAQGLGGDSGRH